MNSVTECTAGRKKREEEEGGRVVLGETGEILSQSGQQKRKGGGDWRSDKANESVRFGWAGGAALLGWETAGAAGARREQRKLQRRKRARAEEAHPRRWEGSWDGSKTLVEALAVIRKETKRKGDPRNVTRLEASEQPALPMTGVLQGGYRGKELAAPAFGWSPARPHFGLPSLCPCNPCT